MIEVLRKIFIVVVYLFGIGIFGIFTTIVWALLVRFIMESKHD